ncbi:hypothetical protein GCM10023201_33750 [Actinomycetospora corticicola]|uniref:Catechol 2,3-dioxygenase-like lactoylglutathione lyase family enzyme n=1 Tax=Actinomycetospora corticicola TaxID=663602 RepID=A0A7Y9DSR4_9PSEU|nr:catechol 2,3-dioxygenase-like lactoylglutathione lyase family enzyme [Actinomycetospora corticicola]
MIDRLVRTRVALVVGDLRASRRFYVEGLDLPVVGEFEDHEGWWGLILGLPDASHQLELTWHRDASPSSGGPDDLLVLGFADRAAALAARARVPEADETRPDNPWWWTRGVTVTDPDGHRVVLHWVDPD